MVTRLRFDTILVMLGLTLLVAAVPADATGAGETHGSMQDRRDSLIGLAAEQHFEIVGVDRVDEDPVRLSTPKSTMSSIREILDGYSFITELSQSAGDESGYRPLRIHVLGRFQPGVAGPATSRGASDGQPAESIGLVPRSDGTRPVSRVNRLVASAAETLVAGSSGTPARNSHPASARDLPADNSASGLESLTRQAAANVRALVVGLRQSCMASPSC